MPVTTATPGFSRSRRVAIMATLVMAGEAVFFLPFVMVRVFRPTLLDVFAVDNLQLGMAFSAYGLVAMVAYFFGGPLADRFSARGLFTLSLAGTGSGGLVMAGIPSLGMLTALYAFWGLTSILLLWAALIRATREWGGESRLGSAFGVLEGGRGLVAAVVTSLGVVLLATFLPEDVLSTSPAEQREGLRRVILWFTAVTFAVAILSWLALPRGRVAKHAGSDPRLTFQGIRRAAAIPAVWVQAVIIVCAYCGYKSLDDMALYAHQVLGVDELRSAGIATVLYWLRPVAAVLAGWLADRWRASGMTLACFALTLAGSLVLSSGFLPGASVAMFLMVLTTTACGVIALRSLYFAIMGEARVPLAVTGAAVGLVSTLGYTPDVFMGPLMGWILERAPGPAGHYHFFGLVAGIAMIGMLATLAFRHLTRQ